MSSTPGVDDFFLVFLSTVKYTTVLHKRSKFIRMP